MTGRLLTLDADLRERKVWFALPDAALAPSRQALAVALGCWWTEGRLTRAAQVTEGTATVRSFPRLPHTPPGSEALLRRLLDPWLGGDGGLALDLATGDWNATAPPAGQARLEQLLAALGDPAPRAPHLLPTTAEDSPLVRPPQGAELGAWCLDLARAGGFAVALAADCDPAAPAPTQQPASLRAAIAALAAAGLTARLHHGCLGIGPAETADRQHPALRAAVAILPVAHLCRDDAAVARLAGQLGARVEPRAWDLPGWAIAPLAWRRSLLVVADPPTIHAVMTALEAVDQTGLDAWLR